MSDDAISVQTNLDANLYERREIPRPCYYFLRLLGLWQPHNSNAIAKFYTNFLIYAVWAFSLFFIAGYPFLYFKTLRFNAGLLVYGLILVITVCMPFMFTRNYFAKGNYDNLISHIIQTNDKAAKKIKVLSILYTFLSFILWILWIVFSVYHRYNILSTLLPIPVLSCAFMCTFGIGWWVCWLSIFCYVCHVHQIQISLFETFIKEKYGRSTEFIDTEEKCCLDILRQFNELKSWLDQSQEDLSKMVSISLTSVIMAMCVFTVVYWNGDFLHEFKLWHYFVIIGFKVFVLLLKVYPPAIVGLRLRSVISLTGMFCMPDLESRKLPTVRLILHQHLVLREQHTGFVILGTRIPSRFTVIVFIVVMASFLTFIKFIVHYFHNV